MDIAFIIITSFAVMISLFFFFQIWDTVSTDLEATTELSNTTRDMLTLHHNNVFETFDGVAALFFFGAFFSIIAAAYFIRTNMAFFVIGMLIVTIFTFVAAVLSNAYADFQTNDAAFQSFVNANFTLSDHILENYPLYSVVLGMLLLISLYAKISRVEAV